MKNKIKTIVSIVVLVILAFLMVSVTLVSTIKKDFLKPMGISNPDYIRVYKLKSEDNLLFFKDSEEYNKIMELFEKSHRESVLEITFLGKLKEEVEIQSKSQSAILTNTIANSSSTIYVEFCYNTPQNIMLNGEVEQLVKNSTQQPKYLNLLVEVKDTDVLTESQIYIERLRQVTSGNEVSYTPYSEKIYSSYRYLTQSVQADLYSYLKSDILG